MQVISPSEGAQQEQRARHTCRLAELNAEVAMLNTALSAQDGALHLGGLMQRPVVADELEAVRVLYPRAGSAQGARTLLSTRHP